MVIYFLVVVVALVVVFVLAALVVQSLAIVIGVARAAGVGRGSRVSGVASVDSVALCVVFVVGFSVVPLRVVILLALLALLVGGSGLGRRRQHRLRFLQTFSSFGHNVAGSRAVKVVAT